MSNPSDRRREQRTPTAFYAVEIRGSDVYYRLVRDLSESGFGFDDRFPLERPGDDIVMEFPLPGRPSPVRVTGRVVYARPDLGVGVRIVDCADQAGYAQLMAVPPPPRKSAKKPPPTE